MGQILSSISGSETTSPKKTTPSYSSRQFDQYSQYDYTQRKSESTFSTFQPSYDTEWSKRLRQAREREAERLREQEAERLRQARRAREQQEAERLRQAIRAREQQEAERLRQARQAREQEAERLRQAREREVIKLFLAGKREKASQVTKNTTSLSNRSYNNVTSGTKNNAPYNVVASSGIKTTSVVIPKVTSGTKENTTSISEENTTSLSKEDRDNIKRITEIVRNVLTRDKNYVVYGNWSCPHWPNSCNNEDEWQRKYSLESFRRYLKLDQKSKKDFFMNECKGCDKKSLVTSFFLYNRQPTYASKEPSVEIVCRLEWNNHYRVFADWKCKRPQHPQHEWKSSYTWISLRNYIENSQLKEGDYYVQKCYDCREECKVCKKKPKEERGCKKCDHDTVILKRSPLVQSTGGKPHKRWLCAKCKGGSICRTDNNYRVPRRRNIELLE